MRLYLNIPGILALFCICAMIPFIASADGNQSTPATGSQTEIFSGSIPSGDGVVSIKAVSGKLYQIPAMTPLGVIQALAGTDIIDTYKVGDELITKRGILTLDGINNYVNSGEDSWFVLVNEKQLQDYLLPTEEGLNTFPLKTGDKIIFAFGNPTKSSRDASSSIRITIGAQSDSVSQVKTGNVTATQVPVTPVSTPVVSSTITPTVTPTVEITPTKTQTPISTTQTATPEQTQKPVASDKDPNQPVYDDGEEKSVVTSESTSSPSKDPNQPVYDDGEEKSVVTSESTSPPSKDPNQPVYDDGEEKSGVTSESTSSPSKDPNQPVHEGSEKDTNATAHVTPASHTKDPNQPVYGDSEESSEITPEETETSTSTDTISPSSTKEPETSSTEQPASSANISKSGQHVLYDGSINLPSGNLNVTASSDVDYDVGADTPLGLLQFLKTDGKIPSMSINDKGMRKGNILAIDSIGDYQYGDEAWFVQVNDVTLQHYTNPGTDGLNIRKIKSGDKVTFFYGKPDQTASSAKAAIYLTIE